MQTFRRPSRLLALVAVALVAAFVALMDSAPALSLASPWSAGANVAGDSRGTLTLLASAPGQSPGNSLVVDVGTTVTLTATASFDTGSAGGIFVEDLDSSEGRQTYCESGTTCSLTVSYSTATTHLYNALIPGRSTYFSNNATVAWGLGSPRCSSSHSWKVSLSSDVSGPPTVPIGTYVTFTATANQDVRGTGCAIVFLEKTTGDFQYFTSGMQHKAPFGFSGPATGTFVAVIANPPFTVDDFRAITSGTGVQATSPPLPILWRFTDSVVHLASLASDGE